MPLHSLKIKVLLLTVTYLLSMMLIYRNINPLSNRMFQGHDETQAARIKEYSLNFQVGNFPPRIAPHFSFEMGYPVFTYYAPFPYILTTLIHLTSIDIVSSLKLSYLLAISVGFFGMLALLKRFFSYYPSLLGAVAYISSPYIATEIFVRANLAEMWFFALFPLTLYLLLTNDKKRFVLTTFVISFLLTSHNIFSLFAILFLGLVIFFTKKRKINYISFGLSLLLSAYFYIPLFAELTEVQASFIATLTDFNDHFLCANQLWTGVIGFAGSARGCELDGMSFMLGKLHILLGTTGLLVFGYQLFRHLENRTYNKYVILFSFVLICSVILPLQQFQFLWQPFGKIAGIIQFPWRLLLLAVFGLSFFTAYLMNLLKREFYIGLLLVVAIFVIFNMKFFYGQTLSNNEYAERYFSDKYISRTVAYSVPEYLSKKVNYENWRSYKKNDSFLQPYTFITPDKKQEVLEVENKPFKRISMVKSGTPITLNIMYMPYWIIQVNNTTVFPDKFDNLGRPILKVSSKSFDTIQATYEQTLIEQLSNLISLGTAIGLFGYLASIFVPSWKHISKKLHIKI